MKIALKILLILIIVVCVALLFRTFGFQFLNRVVVTSSAPPPDLDERVIAFVLVMSFVSLFCLKNWVRK